MDLNATSKTLGLPYSSTLILVTIALLAIVIWEYIWKGIALWKAAKNGHKTWFVILLLINTMGILQILYIYVFSKMNWTKKPITKQKSNINSNKNKRR